MMLSEGGASALDEIMFEVEDEGLWIMIMMKDNGGYQLIMDSAAL